MKFSIFLIVSIAMITFPNCGKSQTVVEGDANKLLDFDISGKLSYSIDEKGNRLPDFSHVGYHSGEKAIPHVPVKITLEPSKGDDTQRIQDALDKLGTSSINKKGQRGALLLKRGTYNVAGTLKIQYSGIVLRGEGDGPGGTIIVATGYDDYKYKRTLISVSPKGDNIEAHTGHRYEDNYDIELIENSRQDIVENYVPVGSNSFVVKSTLDYKQGDRIVVYRPSTQEWISSIGCDKLEARWAGIRDTEWRKDGEKAGFYYQRLAYDSQYFILKNEEESWADFEKQIPLSDDGSRFDFTKQWEAGEYDFYFERKITAVDGNLITIDAPVVHPIDKDFGGGAIYHYESPGRITEVGIENIRLVSEFAKPVLNHIYGAPEESNLAETHAWNGIHIKKNTENIWVSKVSGNYFGWSLISASGKRATIQDCVNLGHASKIEGGRRYTFMVDGQLNLVQRCIAFEGRHEFVNQQKTAGPNVFVDCIGYKSKSNSGPHHRYAVGNLYDNVTSEKPMESRFRGNSGTGHGWAGTQSCFYNCVAPEFLVEAPPGGICWVINCRNSSQKVNHALPKSLYYKQVQDRLGKDKLKYLVSDKQLKNLGKYFWVKKRLKNEHLSDNRKID